MRRTLGKTTRIHLLGHLAAWKHVQGRLIHELALVTLEIHQIQQMINRSIQVAESDRAVTWKRSNPTPTSGLAP